MYERPWFPHCSAPLPEQHIGRLDFPLQNIPDNFHAEIIFSLLSSIRGGCLELVLFLLTNCSEAELDPCSVGPVNPLKGPSSL